MELNAFSNSSLWLIYKDNCKQNTPKTERITGFLFHENSPFGAKMHIASPPLPYWVLVVMWS